MYQPPRNSLTTKIKSAMGWVSKCWPPRYQYIVDVFKIINFHLFPFYYNTRVLPVVMSHGPHGVVRVPVNCTLYECAVYEFGIYRADCNAHVCSYSRTNLIFHDWINWKCFPYYWPFVGDSTGHWLIPLKKASSAEFNVSVIFVRKSCLTNSRHAVILIRDAMSLAWCRVS